MRSMRWLAAGCGLLFLCGASGARARAACVPVAVEAGVAAPRTGAAGGPGCIALRRVPASVPAGRPLRVLVFGDPQPKSARDVDYYRRDIVQPLVGRHGAGLGIALGDIVDDAPGLYPAV
ncbi:MAG TPA: hypothetical protein VL251_04650, partial [Thermomonas sp.]|nr:hypothetical protein [Thermomonas sp.]